MIRVAGMRWGALLFRKVAYSQAYAWTPVQRTPHDRPHGASFTSADERSLAVCVVGSLLFAAAPALADGRTPGSFAVSSTGEAQYTIPIFAPPGINGLAPELALTYSHRHEGTQAGVGWGVSGLSAIHRCEKTWEQNGVAAAPQNALDDRYCLDGMQLRHYSGIYGQPASTYRTEIETHSRITALGPAAGDGPGAFRVELRNGLIYEYGNTADSQILSIGQLEARAWAVNRISDRAGNQISFTWHDDTVNGSYRIDRIDYQTNTVDFQWESKPVGEVRSGYVTGSPVREIHRLSAIEVQQGGAALRRYDLAYEAPLSSTRRSRLASIRECAASVCRDPTTFDYQDGTVGLQGEVDTGQPVPAGALPLDVNGDGRDDLVYVSSIVSGSGRWMVMLANSSGGYDSPRDSGLSNQNYTGAIPFDYDHDGKGDILVPYDNTTWWAMLGSASGLGTLTNTGAPATATGRGTNARALDINGDGRDDLVWADISGNWAGDAISCRLRNTTGIGFSQTVTSLVGAQPSDQRIENGVFSNWAQKQPRRTPDFNGDGRGDIAYRHTRRIWQPELRSYAMQRTVKALCVGGGCSFAQNLNGGASEPTFGDFNGDGLTDLFYYGSHTDSAPSSAPWWHALSRGTYFSEPVEGAKLQSFTLAWVILDWDADGNDDVLAGYGASGEWRLLRATGLGFEAWTSVGITEPGASQTLVTDIDGDGQHDFAFLKSGTWRYRKHAGATADLLSRVTDGYGNTVAVSYAPLTATGVHTKTTRASFPEQDWQGSLTVVTEHTASNGVGGTYSVDHTYEGARLHRAGRGFEGFYRHTQFDDRNNVWTHEYFLRPFPYTGRPELTEHRQWNNALLASTDFSWGALSPSGGLESRTLPVASRIIGRTYDLSPSLSGTALRTTITDTTVDPATGTPTEVRVATTEGSGGNGIHGGATWTERTVHSQLFTSTSGTNWCIGRPQRTQQLNSHSLPDGAQQVRTRATSWDAVHCRPIQQVLEPDLSQWRLQTDLTYDSFGNVEARTLTTAQSHRTWRIGWGADGRFPTVVTDPLNQTTRRAFDARFGSPATETDPNGLVTAWGHDVFGRRTSEVRPDQTRTEWTYAECGSICGQNRLILTAAQKSATGGTIRSDTVHFDTLDRPILTRTQLPGGGYSRVERSYDELGRIERESAPCSEGGCPAPLYWAVLKHDVLGRPILISRPFTSSATQTSTISYAGLRTTISDPLGKISVHTEDGRGHLVRSADHAGYSQTFDFDSFGNPVRVTDSTGRILHSAVFNVRGLRDSATDADLGFWRYAYNAFGEMTSHTDANAKTTTYTWDALGRPLSRAMPEDAGTITRSWTWGALGDNTANAKYIGRLKQSQVTGSGIATYRELYSYDTRGRPTQTGYVQGPDTIGIVNVAYDSGSGLLDSLTYPASTAGYRLKLKYEYDRGLLKRVKDFNAPATVFWEATTMDAYGQILDEKLGNGLTTIRGIEPRTGYINSITSGPVAGPADRQDLEYTWDLSGNLTARQDLNQALTESFEYDSLHRLIGARRNGVETLSLTYQTNGNIATHSGTYTYDPVKPHAVTSISQASGAQSFAYDANGNMTSRNGTELMWFADNRPKRIRRTPTSASNSSEFQYGPDGQRWYHKYNVGGTIYTHVNLGGLLEIVTKGAVDDYRHTIHANGVPIALYSRKSTGTNTLRYLLRDHLDSVDVITTSTGEVELQTNYSALGDRRKTNWSGSVPSADVTALRELTRRGFADHEHLDNNGLIHMNGRVYDPEIARFVSADPFVDGVTNTQGWNRYSYVGNNPLSYTDPSGFVASPANADSNTPDERPSDALSNPFGCTRDDGVQLCLVGNSGFSFPRGRAIRDRVWVFPFMHDDLRERARLERGGTVNDSPYLGQAWGEDFGGLARAISAAVDWLNTESTLISCGIGCAKAWNGDSGNPLAPQANTATNGERSVNAILAVAGVYPFGTIARAAGAAVGRASMAAGRVASAGGVVRRFEQPTEHVYYRVFSEITAGKWLTAVPPRSGAWARDALALPPGNTATLLQEVRVPAGTLLERSRALRVPEWGRLRGGAEQFQLLEEIPLGNFGPGVPLP